MSSAPRWLPIESNPDVMNKFLHSVGLSKSWSITDVFGLDDELLQMVPQPVAALLLLFPITDKCEEFQKEKQEKIKSAEGEADKVYFMHQTIGNACGTVAMIHAVANTQVQLDDGFLKTFLEATKDLGPAERAKFLETDDNVCCAHDEVAKEGQTAAPSLVDKVDYHFVAFVERDGSLYELDGRKCGPLNCGPSSKGSFLKDAALQCKLYMEKDPENIHFTVLALTGGEVA